MKEKPVSNVIETYIRAFPDGVQEILRKLRHLIKEEAPDAEEAIKYQIPTFVLGENLVHFAAYEKHIGLYPTPSAIEKFKEELAGFKSAKGSVQFPLDSPIPYKLIKRIVKFRVKECRSKLASKRGKSRP